MQSTRQALRLEIAHDLHDYIAHDVTAIVAQAQASTYAYGNDPARLASALSRIESLGLHALSAMDEIVGVLAEDSETSTRPHADLKNLVELIDGFTAERGPSCQVEFMYDEGALDPSATSREVQALAHRVIVEALTNVRRHAPATTCVSVGVHVRDPDRKLIISVTNSLGTSPPIPRKAPMGTGLRRLRERVKGLGGDLKAGKDREGRWVLEAWLPMRPGE